MRLTPFCDGSKHTFLYLELPVRGKNMKATGHTMHTEWTAAFSPIHVVPALCLVFGFKFKKVVSLYRFPQE